jgi:protein-S-isoprenylcysteine O-methyltransferase Ste14
MVVTVPRVVLGVVYLAGLVIAEGLRLPRRFARTSHRGKWRRPRGVQQRFGEVCVLTAVIVGVWLLPVAYVSSRWLDSFDYTLPEWAAWLGVALFALGLIVRWAGQSALDRWWSPTVAIVEGHRLVTWGIYSRIRHPIYASLLLWACAQPLLLQNLFAGWAGSVAVFLIWFVRVPAEERMMLDTFGHEYASYADHTGRVLPRLWK